MKGLNDPMMCEKILAGIIAGFNTPDAEVVLTSIKALRDSLQFAGPLFEREDTVTFFVDKLMAISQLNNDEVQQGAFNCLSEGVRVWYERIGRLLTGIYEGTLKGIQSRNPAIVVAATEVWNSIAREEISRKNQSNEEGKQLMNQRAYNGLIMQAYNQLSPFILENLVKLDSDEGEEGGLSASDASFRCLCSFAELIGDQAFENYARLFASSLESTVPAGRVAGLYALQAALEGGTKKLILEYLYSKLDIFLRLLEDSSAKVKINTLRLLTRVAELHPELFFEPTVAVNYFPKFAAYIAAPPVMSLEVSRILLALGDNLSILSNMGDSPFYNHISNIINTLLQNIYREDLANSHHNIDVSFKALNSYVSSGLNPTMIQELLQLLLERFKQAVQLGGQRGTQIQDGLLVSIQYCLLKYAPEKFNIEMGKEIFNIITTVWQNLKSVTTEGLFVIGALSYACGSSFIQFMAPFWEFLTFALNKLDEPELLKAGLSCLTDIPRNIGESFKDYLDQIVPYLLTLVENPVLSVDIKFSIFILFGDIALGVKSHFGKYLSKVLTVFDQAFDFIITSSCVLFLFAFLTIRVKAAL